MSNKFGIKQCKSTVPYMGLMKVGENLELVGIILLVLVIVLIASFITAKIIAVHFFKIIDDFLTSYENNIMDLIRWAKEKDKHQ